MSTPAPPRRTTQGWVIGHVAGAPVILAPSWLLAVAVLTALSVPAARALTGLDGSAVWVVALAFVVLLFVSVFLHEVAHGLVARARGQQPHEFVLTLWGGHTAFGGAAPTPATNALVAIVGPAVNLALGALFGVLLVLDVAPRGTVVWALLWSGAVTNGFVGLFNLLPGLPLDGGRVLEAVVWAVTGSRYTGTVAAGWVGRLVAAGVVVWALWVPVSGGGGDVLDVMWAVLIGAFLWAGASGAIRGARAQRNVEGVTVESVGHRAVTVGHADSLAHAGSVAAAAGVADVVVLAPDGRPAAYVDRAAAASVPPQAAGTTPVTAVSVPLPVGATVDGTLVGQELLRDLARATRLSPVVVALVDGRVTSLLHANEVVAAIRA
ncbi:site-2 protease family protein [Cellulomonas uda]|uniref:Zinc metalloprotease n=1 Tax=Cellulomonas uda TaxID=1714 RepID=A0A4Y3K908_CELUD|nr:site-2 protease family protein [Cellulomonas uda]NII65965.1 Zn-dependent protease [Cellulomonas uda]GEA80473.1 peptidase M50 [Cellulomonas uda]